MWEIKAIRLQVRHFFCQVFKTLAKFCPALRYCHHCVTGVIAQKVCQQIYSALNSKLGDVVIHWLPNKRLLFPYNRILQK